MEPVSFSERSETQRTSQLTALDRLIDAVRPDPPARHWFEAAVKRLLADPKGDSADRAVLAAWFTTLSDAVPAARQQILASPRLAEASTRADQLLELTAMGQQSLEYLASGEKATSDWKAKKNQTLEEIGKPSALVRFAVLPTFSDLVQAVPE